MLAAGVANAFRCVLSPQTNEAFRDYVRDFGGSGEFAKSQKLREGPWPGFGVRLWFTPLRSLPAPRVGRMRPSQKGLGQQTVDCGFSGSTWKARDLH
jgi:hypothetical protein